MDSVRSTASAPRSRRIRPVETRPEQDVLELSGLDHIVVQEASEHNLQKVTLAIPKRKLTVLTGPSGSGKSSLAFDTVFAEGRRRYLDSLSVYARQFIGEMQRPEVTDIRGLGPAIAIDQKTVSNNPRSTVGTITEIYDFMRVLWARVGRRQDDDDADESDAIGKVLSLPDGTRFTIFAPLVRNRKGMFKDLIEEMRRKGYTRMRIDGEVRDLGEEIELRKTYKHNIDLIVDRLKVKDGIEERLEDSVRAAFDASEGECLIEYEEPWKGETRTRSLQFKAAKGRSYAFRDLSPQVFSFNSPLGMCKRCEGLGVTKEFDPVLVIPDRSVSIADGAVAAWDWPYKKNPIKLPDEVLESVARTFDIDLKKPWKKLTAKQRKVLLNGHKDTIDVEWERQGISGSYQLTFRGILAELLELYEETSRDAVKNFLDPFIAEKTCSACKGTRLRPQSRSYKVCGRSITELNGMPVSDSISVFESMEFEGSNAIIAAELVPEITARLGFLNQVGLGYLQLNRSGPTLSGGESQRIRLATQLGSGLTGVTYILDEPSIGLHARDQHRLLDTLQDLRDSGNTIIVVEHDEATMRAADYLIDFGPGAGRHGGEIMYAGPGPEIVNATGMTAEYLSGRRELEVPDERREGNGDQIVVRGARANNLQDLDVTFPLGTFTCVTGVSGAGKSTLVNDILLPVSARVANRAIKTVLEHDEIEGLDVIDRVIDIDQKPIGRTPRSNPATYTKVFDLIRKHFSLLPDSRIYGYAPGRFSFNVKGGRCEECKGAGVRTIEMQFLTDTYVPCEACGGKRFNEATLRVKYRGRSIADILALSVEDALEVFEDHPPISRILQTLYDVGLGYIQLGQPSPTLSGGEAQRIKLSKELSRRQWGHTLYILDEPSTGLHYEDIRHLLQVLNRLVEQNNTVIVIEHNLDIIKSADHLIDLGPEGGAGGGEIVATGTPEEVAATGNGHTARFLADVLA